jgi:hypothetical protein
MKSMVEHKKEYAVSFINNCISKTIQNCNFCKVLFNTFFFYVTTSKALWFWSLLLLTYNANSQDLAKESSSLLNMTLRPVLDIGQGAINNTSRLLRYYSLNSYRQETPATRENFGLTFSSYNDSISNTRLIIMNNLTLIEMVTHFINMENRVLLKVKDRSKFIYSPLYGSKQDWLKQNSYCFQLLLPAGAIEGVKTIDNILFSALSIKSSKQKGMVPVKVLYKIGKGEEFKSIYDVKSQKFGESGEFLNVTFNAISELIPDDSHLFINETGYNGPIRLNLPLKKYSDLISLNEFLKQYDLAIKFETRMLDYWIITDK